MDYNVYEQRGGGLALLGSIRDVTLVTRMGAARKRFMVRYPVLHELDRQGEEVELRQYDPEY